MHSITNTELSSHEETRCQFNGSKADIKLGIDVHQDFYVVVMQEGGSNPKPPQRFAKEAFLHWAAKLARSGAEVHAVYEACGFGFSLQRQLSALGIVCHVVCPQKLDERNKRVKTDGLDAKARSEEHTSELQSRLHLVCRLLLEKKKKEKKMKEEKKRKRIKKKKK